ncbi:MAG: hypothetical protein Q7R43_04165 [Candidatus Daviesbacteria bacterium]|nr:hypothetical protein [Candidatus Daviesbacteria bacterium]
MQNKKNYFSILLATLMLYSLFNVSSVSAQYTPPQGTPNSTFLIDKKIFNPQTLQYVDNLSRDQYLFIPNQTVDFQLVVTNTGNQDLNNLDVTDQLPAELSYVSGGSINKGGQIHFYIDKLVPNQSQTFFLKAKVNVDPNLAGVICPVNLAQALTGSLLDQDTSALCIQQVITKQVPVVTQLPKTGLPIIAWSLVSLLPVGLKLRKMGNQGNNSDSALQNSNFASYISQKREFSKPI